MATRGERGERGQSLVEVAIFLPIVLIILAGIVVKNAIILIDVINRLRADGVGVHRAIVDGAHSRLRPIVMTSLAFVLGVLVFVHELGHFLAARWRGHCPPAGSTTRRNTPLRPAWNSTIASSARSRACASPSDRRRAPRASKPTPELMQASAPQASRSFTMALRATKRSRWPAKRAPP